MLMNGGPGQTKKPIEVELSVKMSMTICNVR